jgi:hypothetical protein
MNRLKLLVAAALLGLPLAACDEGTAPPPVGEIDGQVVIEGEGMDGISVTLSSGAATTTSGGGYYSFADVEGGTYTITISGYPDDASFDATTAEVTIATAGQAVTRNFSGAYIRTASLMGMVTVEGEGIEGVTVSVSGRQDEQMVTDASGQYGFTGLRAGNYTIEISNFDPTDVAFANASSAVTVTVGESKVKSFEGTYVRESTIMGQVSVEGNGLEGVTVSLQGMGSDETAMTDAGGQYSFPSLRAGEYSIGISGFDASEYRFSTTSATVQVAHGRTENIPFEGILLRTAAIMGQVSVEGEGLEGVTVNLSGEGENQTRMTDMSGQYSFTDLPAGNFAVGISGYDADDYSFETTSKNVSLALGETATVPFEGLLLRTSGISGRVSVEGTGLDSVTVTLTDADDMETTRMTDATGQYAFAGLAEGDYTVAISGYDDVAHVFTEAEASQDVTLGDDDTQIVNFNGVHATTASISGMLYVDEAAKNDSFDEGEHALPAPGVVVVLVGPGINDRDPRATGPDGSFAFMNLRAGPYQLVVANEDAAGPDLDYGGPAVGYEFNLAVGQVETQNIPFDITHQTVNFSVTLKSGEATGDALAGATVTLYADLAGEDRIMTGDTDADGMAAIRFARSAATGNQVYAGVAAPAGDYHASGAMQAVMWDPKYAMAAASNEGDIVNTMADFSFSGATVDRGDYGGGMALGGWAVEVTSGDEAVDGAPAALGADGSAKVSETVTSVPKTYEMAMVGWKDQLDDTISGDGGERYTSTTLSHTHDGLSLAGTSTDAGTLEVTYTTQRVRVYVHKENDQVMGFTGNVLGGDARMGGIIDVDIEHVGANGRSSSFVATDSVKSRASGGVYQFWNVPAAANVIVTADEIPTLGKDEDDNDIANTNRLLKKNGHSDEIAAYTDMEANGIVGGLFGANGGFHHTVDLCPLMSGDGDQRHGECSSFAFVETFAVDGQAWKNVVGKTSDDFRTDPSKAGVKDLTVSMDPVKGENLAGDNDSFTAKTAANKAFDFDHMAAGVYTVTGFDETKWIARRGPVDDPSDDLDDYLAPLDTTLNIDVTPTTGYAYGSVVDGENRRMAGVTVNVNGVSVETDSNGRYVAEGFGPRNYRAPGSTFTLRNRIVVTTAEEGSAETTDLGRFDANTPRRIDVDIEDAAEITTISGTVTHSDGGAGVGGVRIWVDGQAPLNENARTGRTGPNNIYITGSDGSFSVRINAKAGGATATITASRDGMFFSPDGGHTFSAVAGQNISGLTFTAFDNGTIHGRVVDGSDSPISGVIVTAEQASPGMETDADTTGTTGTYSLSVRYGQYSVSATKDGYTITDTTGVNVPNDGKALNDLVGTPVDNYAQLSSLSLSGVSLCRGSQPCARTLGGFRSAHDTYTATVDNSLSMTTVTATAGGGADVDEIYPDDADDDDSNGHQIALDVGTTDIEVEVVSKDKTNTTTYTVTVTRRAPSTVITGTITDAEPDEDGNTVGVASVQVRVGGGTLIGGDRFNSRGGYVTTNSSGQYTAIMESGGTGMVTPTKRGYSFDPVMLAVVLNAGSVSGIDFTGSSYATITGTVVKADGDGLEGVTVTATSAGVIRTDDTDRRGRFSVSVPAGAITITATKTGYTFASRTVFADAGDTRSLGDIPATGNMTPVDVEAERDAADGLYDGMVTVTWSAGPGGAASEGYQAQTCVPAAATTDDPAVTCNADDTWATLGDNVASDAAAYTATGAVPSVNGFMVRVQATHVDDGTTETYLSDPVPVGEIDVAPKNADADRDIDPNPDQIEVTWNGARASNTAARVIGSFDGGTTWVVLSAVDFNSGYTAGADDEDPDHEFRFAFQSDNPATNLAVVSGADGTPVLDTNDAAETVNLDAAMMNSAFMIRVQARQPNVDFKVVDAQNVDTWKTSSSADVDAKN